jgi:hypothetical protein
MTIKILRAPQDEMSTRVRVHSFTCQTALANAPPPGPSIAAPGAPSLIPSRAFSLAGGARQWSAGRRQGVCETPLRACEARSCAPTAKPGYPDPPLRGARAQ